MQLLLDCQDRSLPIGTDAIAELRMMDRVMVTEDGHGEPDARRSSGRAGDRSRAAEAHSVTSVHFGVPPAAHPVAAGRSGPLPTVPNGTGLDATAERSPVSVSGATGHQGHHRVNGRTPRPGGLGVILGTGAARMTEAPIPAAWRVRDQRSSGTPSVRPGGQ